jgi:hypothetical protein
MNVGKKTMSEHQAEMNRNMSCLQSLSRSRELCDYGCRVVR